MPNESDLVGAIPPTLLHELVARGAVCWPDRTALTVGGTHFTYGQLHAEVEAIASGLCALGLQRGARVAVYLEKRLEAVIASFGVPAAGGILVPVNPLLKSAQVLHIVQDAGVQVLITSAARLTSLAPLLAACPSLVHVVVCDAATPDVTDAGAGGPHLHAWAALPAGAHRGVTGMLETDPAAIFYTSGSTGRPKGVVLTHRNFLAGATSVASYLCNSSDDVLLAALPLSFDAGFSQLTTAFLVGARVVLLNVLLPRDVQLALTREGVTGLTAVPALYMQLAALSWPEGEARHLRYWANTGGRMPRATLQRLREVLPSARPFLMYGLTEAFRSTYLPPEEIDRRPDSIGRAIPNADIRVLRADGTDCDVDEPGELVHRGPLVAQGYWNRPEETAERFRPLEPVGANSAPDHARRELAVFSGDAVRRDAEGFLYFVGRRDEMIKTSGYRVSPLEVEEVVYASGMVSEALAVGVASEALGQVIHVAAVAPVAGPTDTARLIAHCREHLPAYMVPAEVHWSREPLPRNPNGKIDRKRWLEELESRT